MSLPLDTPQGIANTLGYLQHHLHKLTERQNVSKNNINTTLAALTTQLQQLTQLVANPVRLANSKAGIKPTAPLLAFDKENSIEFLLDFSTLLIQLLHSLCTSFPCLSCDLSCDIMWYDAVTSCHVTVIVWHLWHDTFLHFLLCSKSKIKEKKRKKI